MVWYCHYGIWKPNTNTFIDHQCTNESAKKPRFHANSINYAIKELSLVGINMKLAELILKSEFEYSVSAKSIRSRLSNNEFFVSSVFWKSLPVYLSNNIFNGGLSDLSVTEKNEVLCFAMLSNYGKRLLSSNAILHVIIIDGIFQCSVYRGTIIIAMVVSSNRTNIPICWVWGRSENEETIAMLLSLIQSANPKIETIISDKGTALKSAINSVFPKATHKLCAWHLAKSISNPELRRFFWEIIQSDHPLLFKARLCMLIQKYGNNNDLPEELHGITFDTFSSFFEGTKSNGLKTSSPCESINSEIRKLKERPPIDVFHYLELIGYSRCLDLLDLKGEFTPYFLKRKII